MSQSYTYKFLLKGMSVPVVLEAESVQEPSSTCPALYRLMVGEEQIASFRTTEVIGWWREEV